MKSIRRRLFWTTLVAITCLSVLVGLLLYIRISASMLGQFDDALEGKAKSLAALMRVKEDGTLDADFTDNDLPEFFKGKHAAYLQVSDPNGHVLFRSPSLGKSELPINIAGDLIHFQDERLPNGRHGRSVDVRFTPEPDEDESHRRAATHPSDPMILTLAESRHELDERLESLLAALAVGGVVMSAGIVVVTVLTVRTGLSNLHRFAHDVDRIDINTLSQRIDDRAQPLELAPISSRMNELLSKLQSAFDRERRFTADAAHELRTPIAELRSLAEVALRNEDSSKANREFFQDALAISRQMETLVTTLLALARSQRNSIPVERQVFNLSAAVDEAFKPFEEQARDRMLKIDKSIDVDAIVTTNRVLTTSILNNLIANAVDYTPVGGRIEFQGVGQGGGWVLLIKNTNTSIAADDLPKLFDPFWRKDSARSDSKHFGLGLPLVAAFAKRIGMKVDVSLTAPDKFCVTIIFPRA